MAEVPVDKVNWLEVALYWERLRPRDVSNPGELGDGVGGTTYADPSSMKYIEFDGERGV